ncbi:hypothetical protein PFICI_02725 [Pestalotiopsis fici W106-1]|uniref:3beta-hydroxysteroid 3-dehydrogenase n=1 Tax=Pestalotiopsis fici (strain W106-1 / CGMCC3.15140) TaxID=1229662 RepID=W3XF82_PESFW|nr:uncharacterized protein PFICI_02725 [Pestalotiopsis fici W106-1]ETS84700.1 hypothetical protein PFICI_02725 [Pestalotiopsis fici W106-1]
MSILLTGASGGLGGAIFSQIVSTPALRAHHGIYAVRDAASSKSTFKKLSSSSPFHSYELVSLDLSRLQSVREVAAAINAQVEVGSIPPITAIILNAGYEEAERQTWTEDGLDMSFMVNYLGHWLLTLLLLQSVDRERGRIVWISSWAQNPEDPHNIMNGSFKDNRYKTMVFDDLEPLAKGTWSSNADDNTSWAAAYRRYGASKMCGVAMIHELQSRLDQDPLLSKISVLAIDPGAMATGIIRHSHWFVRVLVFRVFAGIFGTMLVYLYPNGSWRTPRKSARDVLAAAFDCGPPPLTAQPKGVYLNGSEAGQYSSEAKDPKKGQVIWEGSLRSSALEGHETILRQWR